MQSPNEMSKPGSPFDLIDAQLQAEVLGTYSTDHALIRLARDASFWLEGNEPTVERLAVFLHEYAHFLHNFSTIAGFYGFIAQLRLLALFINTVDSSGRSLGDGVLSSDARRELENVLAWKKHLVGTVSHPWKSSLGTDATVITLREVSRHSQTISFPRQTFEVHGASVKLTTPLGDTEVIVGSQMLMEGLAWELERLVYVNHRADSTGLDRRYPVFPYKLPRVIFEGICSRALSPEEMSRVLLLVLQCSDPGSAFIAMAEAMRGAPERVTGDLLGAFESQTLDVLRAGHEDIFRSLQEDIDKFKPRAPIWRALGQMTEWATGLFRRRLVSPFFELDLVGNQGRERLAEMLKQLPSCPIIHETGDYKENIEFFVLAEEQPSPDSVNDLGVTQALLHFAARHITWSRLVSTENAQPAQCRFYGACKAPPTANQRGSCLAKPWETFIPDATERCWYAGGVQLGRGLPLQP